MERLKKVLAVCFTFFALLILSQLVLSQNIFAEPVSGNGIYRDMELYGCGPFGHAGLSIGSGQVIHMQGSGCSQASFSSTFSTNYWGAISQGDTKSAETRVKTAKAVKDKQPKYHFLLYKLFPSYFRCDGFVEYCFEQAGGGIIADWGWFTMAPRTQWQSSRISRSDITTLGTSRYSKSLASDYNVDSTAATLLMLAPLMI